jgi:hypothetical protein
MRCTQVALAFALASLVSSFSLPAAACSWPCPGPLRLFERTDVPGNLVYFEVFDGFFDEASLPFTLHTAAGEPIAASVRQIDGRTVFAPDQPIADGTDVVLEYGFGCSGDAQPFERRTFAFSIAEAPVVAPPRPRVTLARRGFLEEGSACDTAFVELRVEDETGWEWLADLTTISASVDGVGVGSGNALDFKSIELRSLCGPGAPNRYSHNSCGGSESIPVGVHTLTLTTTILGQPDPAPVELDFEIQCEPGCDPTTAPDDDDEVTASPDADESTEPPGDVISSSGTASGEDTGTRGRLQIGGCSLQRGGHGGWLVMLLLPWLLARRRRADHSNT